MSAAILAGGFGTRLQPVLADRPKVLAPVAGQPFLGRILDQLAAAGVDRAVLCTGYLGDQVEAAFGARWHGMQIDYSREAAPLGTGGALREALTLLSDGPVLVLNGDSYCAADLAGFRAFHSRQAARISIVLAEVQDVSRYGCVTVDPAGMILRFEEKQAMTGPGWINAGIYLLSREVLEAIPAGRPVSLEREVFPAAVGHRLAGFRSPGRFLDIGTPDSYAEAEQFFA